MPKDFEADRDAFPDGCRGPRRGRAPVAPATAAPAGPPPATRRRPRPRPRAGGRRVVLGVVAAAVLGAAGWFGYHYWTVGRFMVDTDDAYVQADFAMLAPKITGYVAAVPAVENEAVKAGDPLVVLEDGDYRDALRARRGAARRPEGRGRAHRQPGRGRATPASPQAEARVEAAQATLKQADADLARYQRPRPERRRERAAPRERRRRREAVGRGGGARGRGRGRDRGGEPGGDRRAERRGRGDDRRPRGPARQGRGATSTRRCCARPSTAPSATSRSRSATSSRPASGCSRWCRSSAVYVEANFKETQIAELGRGTEVHLHFDAFPDRDVIGTVAGHRAGLGRAVQPAAAGERHRQLHQGRPARAGPHRGAGRLPPPRAGSGPGLSVQVSADVRTAAPDAAAVAAR